MDYFNDVVTAFLGLDHGNYFAVCGWFRQLPVFTWIRAQVKEGQCWMYSGQSGEWWCVFHRLKTHSFLIQGPWGTWSDCLLWQNKPKRNGSSAQSPTRGSLKPDCVLEGLLNGKSALLGSFVCQTRLNLCRANSLRFEPTALSHDQGAWSSLVPLHWPHKNGCDHDKF